MIFLQHQYILLKHFKHLYADIVDIPAQPVYFLLIHFKHR